jgi:hypothetical protein
MFSLVDVEAEIKASHPIKSYIRSFAHVWKVSRRPVIGRSEPCCGWRWTVVDHGRSSSASIVQLMYLQRTFVSVHHGWHSHLPMFCAIETSNCHELSSAMGRPYQNNLSICSASHRKRLPTASVLLTKLLSLCQGPPIRHIYFKLTHPSGDRLPGHG